MKYSQPGRSKVNKVNEVNEAASPNKAVILLCCCYVAILLYCYGSMAALLGTRGTTIKVHHVLSEVPRFGSLRRVLTHLQLETRFWGQSYLDLV